MDPMSFLLEDPFYHLTNDVYAFDPSEFPLDFPNPEPYQELGQQPASYQPGHNNSNHVDISLILMDEGQIDGQGQGVELEGNAMNGEATRNEGRINGDRKRRKKEKPKVNGKEKMEMHREAERQRRQEMASLHRSLRSLLPAEYLKGKRSMSDHLHEAVKYTRHLKVKVQALRGKRDCLKGGAEVDPISIPDFDDHRDMHKRTDQECPGQCVRVDQVSVKACRDGVEVLVGVSGEPLSTSRVLKALMQEGLDVTSCSSTHTDNDKWAHCLRAQAGDGSNVYTELQQRLTKRLSA